MIALAGITLGLFIILLVYSICCVANPEHEYKEDSDYDEIVEPEGHQAPHQDEESPSTLQQYTRYDQTVASEGRSTSQKKLVLDMYGQRKPDEEYEGGVNDQDDEGNLSQEYDEHVDPNMYRIPQNNAGLKQQKLPQS